MKLIVEYLIIIERKASEALFHLCDRVEEFNKLLRTSPDIVIEGNIIEYKRLIRCVYETTIGRVEGKEQRFFRTKFIFDDDEGKIEIYTKLLKTIRGIVYNAGGQSETLWDDVSFYYAEKSYPLIHRIENLMRKLITYFMLTNVGKEWVTATSPGEVRAAIDKSKRKQYLDVLHQVDFKHLGDFLFKPYQTKNVSDLYERLDKVQKLEDLDLNELKDFTPKSNWERYFSSIVDCEDDYLDKRWTQLYDLRCMVAHNALIVKAEYERISELVIEVEEKLTKAIDNLDKVYVPKEDKEIIAENVASNINTAYGDFILSWQSFEARLFKFKDELGKTPKSPMQALHLLRKDRLIDDELYELGISLMHFRNALVHGHGSREFLSEQEIYNSIFQLGAFMKRLEKLLNEKVEKEPSNDEKNELTSEESHTE